MAFPYTPQEIGRLLGQLWRAASAEERKPYEEKAAVDADRFRAEKQAYLKLTQPDRLPPTNPLMRAPPVVCHRFKWPELVACYSIPALAL